jgi:type IV pilus assembly protein PilA
MSGDISRITKGFTLLELMIVVAIVGIMTAIAIPNFMKFQCKAKQSEAKLALSAMYRVERAYSGEWGTSLNLLDLTSFGGLDPKVITGAKYYRYSATNPPGPGFYLVAEDQKIRINPSGIIDQWDIDWAWPDGAPRNFANACR